MFVRFCSLINMKSHMFIKADRQRILLIDCQIIYAINIDHISKQCFSYPRPLYPAATNSISSLLPSVPAKATGQPPSVSAMIKCGTSDNACGTYRFMRSISFSDRNKCVALTELSQINNNDLIRLCDLLCISYSFKSNHKSALLFSCNAPFRVHSRIIHQTDGKSQTYVRIFYEKRKNFSGLSTKAKKKGAKGRRIGNISTKALPPREEKAIRKRFSADAFSAAGILSSLGFSCRLRFGKLIF